MKVEILPSARDDLSVGFEFYEKQAAGLGAYFLDSLLMDIDSLGTYAGIHRKVLEYHRLLSKRFPCAVYYRVEGDAARVSAVVDCRRNPYWIKQKLQNG